MRRRAFLGSAAAGLVGVAGCLAGGDDEGTEETPTTRPVDDPTATPPPSATPTPGPGLTRTGPTPTEGPASPTETPTDPPGGIDPVPTATGDPATPGSVDSAWPLPASDAGFTNHTAAPGPASPVAELWRVPVETGLSAPVLADGTVYAAGRDGAVLALDARDGAEQWRRSVDERAATPGVVGGNIYVPTEGGLVAFGADDGREEWRVTTPDRADSVGPDGQWHGTAMLVFEGGIYTVSGEDPPAVVRRSLADGSEEWRTDIAEPWDLPIFTSGEGEVFVSSGPHDTRFWRLDARTGEILAAEPRHGADFPAERFYADGAVFTVEPFFGSVGRVPLGDGTGWSTSVPPAGYGGALTDGAELVYYTTTAEQSRVFALSKSDGTTVWEAETPGQIVGRPVAAGDVVAVPTDAGLYGVAPSDGSDRWLRPGDATGEEVIVADDLVASTREGAVRAFRAP